MQIDGSKLNALRMKLMNLKNPIVEFIFKEN